MSQTEAAIQDTARAYQELREAIAGLPDADRRKVWLGGWGVRELLIHISGWHREMIPALERIARGERPYPPGAYDDADGWNTRFVEARTSADLGEVLEELESSHRDFVAAAARLAPDELAPGRPARELLDGSGAKHYREHAAQIRTWCAGLRV
jgi:hypothetical protein